MRRATTGLVVLAAAILVASAGGCSVTKDVRPGAAGSRTGTGSTPSSNAGQTLEFVVPNGTAARIKAGEKPDVFPQRLEVRVGDRIRIRNEDLVGHTVGPYYVGAGETVEQVFTTPTTIEGYCSLHPESQVKIVVT